MRKTVSHTVLRAPNGIRTRATALKGRRPRPLDDEGYRPAWALLSASGTCEAYGMAGGIAKTVYGVPAEGVGEGGGDGVGESVEGGAEDGVGDGVGDWVAPGLFSSGR